MSRRHPPDADDGLGARPGRLKASVAPVTGSMAALRAAVAEERAARAAAATTHHLDPSAAALLPRNARPAAARPPSKWVRKDPAMRSHNKGVGSRAAAADEGAAPAATATATTTITSGRPDDDDTAALARSEAALARKAALYDALVAGELTPDTAATAGGCVNFRARATEEAGRAADAEADASAAAADFLAKVAVPPPPPLPPPPPPHQQYWGGR